MEGQSPDRNGAIGSSARGKGGWRHWGLLTTSSDVTTRPNESKLSMALAAPSVLKSLFWILNLLILNFNQILNLIYPWTRRPGSLSSNWSSASWRPSWPRWAWRAAWVRWTYRLVFFGSFDSLCAKAPPFSARLSVFGERGCPFGAEILQIWPNLTNNSKLFKFKIYKFKIQKPSKFKNEKFKIQIFDGFSPEIE